MEQDAKAELARIQTMTFAQLQKYSLGNALRMHGKNYPAVAKHLGISLKTVYNHLGRST